MLASKVANAKDIAVTGSIGGTSKRVPWQSATDITVDYATTVANGLIGGYPSFRGPLSGIRIIKVTATPTYLGVGFLNSLGLTTMTLNVAHSERCIGQG